MSVTNVDPQVRSSGKFLQRPVIVLALCASVLAIGGYGFYWWQSGRFMQTTDDAYVGGNMSVVSTKVAGYISEIAVNDNARVKKGDLLIRIDDRDYRAALDKSQAEIAAQEAALENIAASRQLQLASISGAKAAVDAALAVTSKAAGDSRRYDSLANSAAISQQIKDNARADYHKAQADEAQARADYMAAQRQLAVLDAQEKQTQASLAQAHASANQDKLNLSYTQIKAPFDGVVGNRHIWMGSYVGSGTQLLSLVSSSGLWVDANFKENQLARMQPGQPVKIIADVLSGRTFHGRVSSLSPATGSQFSILPAENATGNFTKIVQRVPVRIELDNQDAELGLLRPGLSVEATVDESGKP